MGEGLECSRVGISRGVEKGGGDRTKLSRGESLGEVKRKEEKEEGGILVVAVAKIANQLVQSRICPFWGMGEGIRVTCIPVFEKSLRESY